MLQLPFSRRHKLLTFVMLILAGAGIGYLIEYTVLGTAFGVMLATILAYGQPPRHVRHRPSQPERERNQE
jgi:F0F1-type ATP synthase assembly protein I